MAEYNVSAGRTSTGITLDYNVMNVLSGGRASQTTVNEGGCLYVDYGGSAYDTTINSVGYLGVFAGGKASKTTVNNKGEFWVLTDGAASNTLLNEGGLMHVRGSANGTTLNGITSLYVSKYGKADDTTIDNGGTMSILSGGTANKVTINDGGTLIVLSSGTANNVTVNAEGYLEVSPNGIGNNVTINVGGRLDVCSEAKVNDLLTGGEVYVYSQGKVDNINIGGGNLYISSGGTANNITGNGGNVYVLLGGIASNIKFETNNVSLFVSSGGIVYDCTMRAGEMFISSGGIASDASIKAGSMCVLSGGTANSVSVSYTGNLYVSSGGTAINAIVSSKGYFFVSNGGIVDHSIIASGGTMCICDQEVNDIEITGGLFHVSSGGVANNTKLNQGDMIVFADGVTSNTTINGGGGIVGQGGIANETTINEGLLSIDSRGIANGVVVNGGTFTILSRGTATEVTENGGCVIIHEAAKVRFVPHVFSGTGLTNATVHSGTIASNVSVNSITVFSGGTAIDTSALNVTIASGGTVINTDIGVGGTIVVLSNGLADNTSAYGKVHISSGGTANNTIARLNCEMFISSGGLATNTQVNGFLYVLSGGTANTATIGSDEGSYGGWTGSMHISQGGMAENTTIVNGHIDVFYAGTANNTTVNGGWIYVSSGGTANNTVINNGFIEVLSGGTANNITVCEGGSLFAVSSWIIDIIENGGYADISNCSSASFLQNTFSDLTLSRTATVHSGTTASNTTIGSGGGLLVFSGGVANGTTVVSGGMLNVSSGAIVNNTIVKDKGGIGVMSGGVVKNTTVDYEGSLQIISGTTATRTTVNPEGLLYVSFGGTAIEVIENGGYVHVEDGADISFASNSFSGLVISDFVSATLHSGTTASTVLIEEDGELYVFSGGKITGQMTFEDGAIVSVCEGAILDFDISNLTPKDTTRVSNLSLVQGTPFYTLTVSDKQRSGTYVLASSAASFNSSVALQFSTGELIENLCLGEAFMLGETSYTLNLNNSILSLAVVAPDHTPPIVSDIKADIISPTNQDVTITVVFEDDNELSSSLYRVGENGEWKNYSDGVTVTENTTVYFKAIDTAGNESEIARYRVKNIDKEKPIITLTGDNQTPLQKTTLTASVDDGSPIYYRIGDSGEWTEYKEPITVSDNATYNFKATDAAGNEGTNFLTFENIDSVAPVITLTGDTETPLQKATLTASTDDGSAIYYRIGDVGEWIEYREPITVTDNVTYNFKATDTAGNEGTNFLTFANIDTVAPVIALDGDNQTPLKQAILTASTDDGSPIYYRIGDSGDWTEYKEPITVTDNVTYNFKATDTAGNEGTNFLSFENIDTTAPVIALSGDNQTPLQKVTLTASTDDGSPIYYRIGDTGEWMEYKEPITVTDNATYNFLATDAAGNEGTNFLTFGNIIPAPISDVSPQTQTWEQVGEAAQYIVEYSMDNFEHVIQVTVNTNSLDSFQMPAGNYQMRVKVDGGDEWTVATPVVAEEAEHGPKLIRSNADGNADVFFMNSVGTWESGYVAQHVGSTDDDTWGGTNEYASVFGKNKLADIIEGSTDANVMLMTDDANGDALFVDDIYSSSPDELGLSQSRIARIDEIRAGVGNDIVDMTSHRFEYTGDGLTIRGGDGDDTIWANKGDNFLFGDAGNDRIVGASGNDVIVGGIGNDRMHGGGGNDIFTFCDNWGMDTVEQLAGGSVTLWFANGDESKWNAETLTYTDGDNTVTVKGVTSVTLKFGGVGEDAAMFATLSEAGAFKEFTSQKIFEESKGLLA